MKTFKLLSVLFLLIGITLFTDVKSQNLINPDFEQTDTISGFAFLTDWEGDGYGGSPSTLSQNGNYSLMIWNWYWYGVAPAYNGDEPFLNIYSAYKGGTPYTQKATKLNGYYRYDTTNTQTDSDSAIVAVLLKKYNTSLQKVDTIGYGITYLTSYSPGDNSFASFEVIITDMQPGVQPDSIVVFMQSSINGFCAMSTNGECLYLNIDNLSLETPLGISDIKGNILKPEIFPNPNNGNFSVSIPSSTMETVQVFSIDGKLIYAATGIASNKISIAIQNQEAGFYIIKILDTQGKIYSDKFVLE